MAEEMNGSVESGAEGGFFGGMLHITGIGRDKRLFSGENLDNGEILKCQHRIFHKKMRLPCTNLYNL